MKYLSLLAIVGLLFSIGLVGHVSANAPLYTSIPSVKLFANQGLTPAFDLAQYNTAPDAWVGDAGTGYSIVTSFLSMSKLSSSSFSNLSSNVIVGGYSSATDGVNTFAVSNAGGTANPTDKVKIATYKIYELPRIGLNVGQVYTVIPVAYNTTGAVQPPSFGNPTALIVSDTTKVSAAWDATSTKVIITLIASTSAPVTVDVVASPVAGNTTYYSNVVDQDKERIWVFSNLLANGSFTTASDLAAYAHQPVGVATYTTSTPSISYVATVNDSASSPSINGVMQLVFADNVTSDKITPFNQTQVPTSAGSWYMARVRAAASANVAGTQLILFTFNGSATQDIAAGAYISGIPTTWSWVEAPVYVHTASNAVPQLQIRAGGAQTVNIDEIQIIAAAPSLYDANNARLNTRAFWGRNVAPASIGADTGAWGAQTFVPSGGSAYGYVAANTYTTNTSIGNSMVFNFAGASGSSKIGSKWTASTTLPTPQSFAATVGRQVGVRVSFGKDLSSPVSPGVDEVLGLVLGTTGAYGVAQVGALIDGTIRTAVNATDSSYVLQLVTWASEGVILDISGVDFDADNNDPNFGVASLFP